MLKLSRRTVMLGALAPAFPRLSWAQSDEIRVICSGGFTAAYNILAPRFEQITGKKVASAYGASMGNAPDAIPQRLARGEPTDIIILARPALDDFSARSVVRPDSRVDLAESRIGVAVRAGEARHIDGRCAAPHPLGRIVYRLLGERERCLYLDRAL